MKNKNLEKGLQTLMDITDHVGGDVTITVNGDLSSAERIRSIIVFLDKDSKPNLVDVQVA